MFQVRAAGRRRRNDNGPGHRYLRDGGRRTVRPSAPLSLHLPERLNLILACIVYWQACEISRVLRRCDPIANGIDLSLLEHVSPIEWDNVVLYGQYILDRKLVRRRRFAKRVVLSV